MAYSNDTRTVIPILSGFVYISRYLRFFYKLQEETLSSEYFIGAFG